MPGLLAELVGLQRQLSGKRRRRLGDDDGRRSPLGWLQSAVTLQAAPASVLEAMQLSCATARLSAASPLASQRQQPGAARRAACLRVQCAAADVEGLRERAAKAACAVALSLSLFAGGASARLEGVNKPELLPSGPVTPVIDVAGFLTPGEEARIRARVEGLERDTGVKLRVLAQNYPQTPGLAIKDYWGVDGDTVVFVADPNTGNILNFNVGENVDLLVPRNFWTRVAGRWGVKFYWQDNGPSASILNAVTAIDNCLREPMGRTQCSTLRGETD